MNVFNSAIKRIVTVSEKRSAELFGGSLFPMYPAITAEGKKVNSNTALKISAFYCGVNNIANDVALLPKSIYRETDSIRERQRNHPVDYLVHDEPNTQMTAFVFWFTMVVCLLLKGKMVALIKRASSGYPESLTFWHPDDVSIIEFEDNLYYIHKGKTYMASDVFHIPNFTLDGINGRSVIQYAADNMGMSIAADQFGTNSYTDKGIVYGVAESDQKINDLGAKNITTMFSNAMNSNSKHKIAVFDEGLKFRSLTLTPGESEFIKAKATGVEDIARWLNIPLHKLHAPGEGGYNFLVQMSIAYLQSAIMPIGEKIKQESQRKLLSKRERVAGHYLYINYKKLLEVDPETRAKYYKDMYFIGAKSPNEIRKLEDDNPRDGGDEFFQMSNMLTQEQAAQVFSQ
jgi:HK97 family phage portal protein